jgi:hypothetical protein
MFAGLCHIQEELSFSQMSTTIQKQLSLASSNFNDMYMSFQLPAVENCLFCGGSLCAEQPAHSTVFTLHGAFSFMIDYLRFYVPLKNISLIRRRHHCR